MDSFVAASFTMCVLGAHISTMRNMIVFGNLWLVFIISHTHLILFFCCLFFLSLSLCCFVPLVLLLLIQIVYYTFLLFHSQFFIHSRSFSFFLFASLYLSICIVSSFTTTAIQIHKISFGKFVFCMILFFHQFGFVLFSLQIWRWQSHWNQLSHIFRSLYTDT